MSNLNITRFQNLNAHRKETQQQVTNALSLLTSSIGVAAIQQAYMRANPDNNGADELLPVISADFLNLASKLNDLFVIVQDMQQLQEGAMTVDAFVAKHNINLSEYSAELI